MADSPVKRLLVQASHYSVASLFTTVAGLVTFPLLTRVFSVADYGVMSLVAATVSVGVALGKLGVQHSMLRYHSEIDAGKSRYTLGELYSTTFFGMLGTALAVMALLVIGTQLVPARWLGADPRLRALFAVASILIVVQVTESSLINFLRAELRTTALMKYQVAKKYLGLAAIVLAVLVISRTLTSFYSASVISESLAVIVLGWILFRGAVRPRPRPSQFSRPLYAEVVALGIPMMIGYEMSGIVLAVGDRYVIEGTIGETPLGLYVAAYNLCQYLQAVVVSVMGQAIMPIYMRMWDREGREKTAAFIEGSLRTYVMIGAPLVAGLASVGPELLPALASEKYASAARILPWVIGGMVVEGSNAMLGAGLFIHRRTRTIAMIVFGCAAINIGLNLVLVPRIGILGAAIATLVSYALTSILLGSAGHSLLPVSIPWGTLLRAGVAAGVMYVALIWVVPGRRLVTVFVRALAGAPIYGAIMGMIDGDARALVKKGLARFRAAE